MQAANFEGEYMKKLISVLLAIAMLISSIAFGEVSFSELLAKGGNYAVNGEFEKAEAAFEIAMKMEPENIRVYEAIGHMCILKGDFEGALRALDTALSYAPGEGELYLEKAKILYQTGDTLEAERALLYAEVCGYEADDSLLNTAINAYYKSGDFDKVISMYEQLSKGAADESLTQAYVSALILTGQKEKALSLGLSLPENANQEIAEAIDGKKTISIKPVEFPNILSCPVYMSKNVYEQWKKAFPDANIFNMPTEDDGNRIKFSGHTLESFVLSQSSDGEIRPVEPRFIDISPDMNTYLYSVFYVNPFALDEKFIYCKMYFLVKDEEATVLMLNIDRSGMADNELLESQSFSWFAPSGFYSDIDLAIWSKDGRCRATFARSEYLDCFFTPQYGRRPEDYSDIFMIADMETGELIPIFLPEDTSIVAGFDMTSENLFYIEYYDEKQEAGYAQALKKYCMETGETEILYTHENPVDLEYLSDLCISENDTVISAIGRSGADFGGRAIYTKTEQGWTYEYALDEYDESDVVYRADYHYSAQSDIGIYECGTGSVLAGNFLSIGSDTQPMPGFGHLVFLPRDADEAFTLPVSQMTHRAEGVPGYYSVGSVAMSPDGYYALVGIDNYDMMFVLDLCTLKFTEVLLTGDELETSYSTTWRDNNIILNNHTLFSLTIE